MILEPRWQCYLQQDLACNITRIYIYRDSDEGGSSVRHFITDMSDDANFVCTTIKEGESMRKVKPTMTLTGASSRGILQALADALFDNGIRPKAEPILKNELTAVRDHLQDMRDIVSAFHKMYIKDNG